MIRIFNDVEALKGNTEHDTNLQLLLSFVQIMSVKFIGSNLTRNDLIKNLCKDEIHCPGLKTNDAVKSNIKNAVSF